MKQVRHEFSATDYKSATQDYLETWKIIDEVLYRLCRDHPKHSDLSSVTAKVVIIGRTYATGIERHVSTKGKQGSSISQVVELFFTRRIEIDQWLGGLVQITEPLTISGIEKILNVHGMILNLLTKLTKDGEAARSFVSKYMHFHNPVVPIYDNIADTFLPKFVRLRKHQIISVEHADGTYAAYVSRLFLLYDLASKNLPVTVRLLDYYLIWKKENGQAGLAMPGR